MDTAVSESTDEVTDDQNSSYPGSNGAESDHLGTLTVSNSECEQNGGSDCCIRALESVGDEFVPPDEKVLEKIMNQVEYYFSDVNIMKDTFLLKHVRRNKEGYVSLKLIASFRKVKSLTKDWRVVAYSLTRSEKLEVNQEATKIRRKNPLPEFEDTSLAKTVVAFHLPVKEPTSEEVSKIFSKYGNVSEVVIINPGETIPASAKRCIAFHKEDAAVSACAMIEFEAYDSAVKALKDESLATSDYTGMKVVPLLSNSYKKVSPTGKNSGSPVSKSSSQKKQCNGQRRNGRLEQIKSADMESTTSCSEAEQSPMVTRRGSTPDLGSDKERLYTRSRRSNKSRKRVSSPLCNGNSNNRGRRNNGNGCNSFRHNGFANNSKNHTAFCNNSHLKSSNCATTNNGSNCSNGNSTKCFCTKSPHCSEGDGAGTSPWVQRRQLAAKDGGNVTNNSRYLIPEGVIRLPRGPDGTNGFHRARLETPENNARNSPTYSDACRSLVVSH